MIDRSFGSKGFSISPLTFGAMRLPKEPGPSAAMLYALEQGITAIDTARVYGDSERIICETLKHWTAKKPFISTKVKPAPGDWRHYCDLEQAYTPESMRASVEESLRTLNVECIDLVYLHQWYYLWTHRPEWLETFRKLKKEGKILGFGISAQDHEHDALLQVVDTKLVDAVQVIINLFESRPFTSLVPLCEQRGVAVIARCILDDGALTGFFNKGDFEKSSWLNDEFYSSYRRRLQALDERYCQDGMTLLELAIRFVSSSSGVTSLTMSMQEREFVESNIRAIEKGPLSPAVLQDIRQNFVWSKNFFEPQFPRDLR